jgi:DNA invertase Pin-like site-specific DNA recombinase
MARGRTTALTIRLTLAERRTLLAWQRATTIPAGLARRGRILLLRADGMSITAIARTVGLSRQQVYKWIAQFTAISGDLLSAVISIRYIFGFRKDNLMFSTV